jgi:hypothetical protein
MYQRGCNGRFYIEDNATGKQESLGTSDRNPPPRHCHLPLPEDALNRALPRVKITQNGPKA